MSQDEKTWVHSFVKRLDQSMKINDSETFCVEVVDAYKLPYACEITSYNNKINSSAKKQKYDVNSQDYETDVLVIDSLPDGRWIPRIVIECKLGGITTHDALTYSAKAATHKYVHPYLRYGILVGNQKERAIPGRLVRHGTYFDFMIAWKELNPQEDEWDSFCGVLNAE